MGVSDNLLAKETRFNWIQISEDLRAVGNLCKVSEELPKQGRHQHKIFHWTNLDETLPVYRFRISPNLLLFVSLNWGTFS